MLGLGPSRFVECVHDYQFSLTGLLCLQLMNGCRQRNKRRFRLQVGRKLPRRSVVLRRLEGRKAELGLMLFTFEASLFISRLNSSVLSSYKQIWVSVVSDVSLSHQLTSVISRGKNALWWWLSLFLGLILIMRNHFLFCQVYVFHFATIFELVKRQLTTQV